MTIIDDIEPLAVKWRERKIPILRIASARWLRDLVEQKRPKRILEIGTAVGYSGTILASPVGQGETTSASLVTIDSDENALKTAEETFVQFGIDAQIISEDATETLRDITTLGLIPGDFDFIFIDHAKAKYLEALEYCIKLSKSGTIIVADNTSNSKCKSFVDAIKKDPRLETTMIDVGDGMSMSVVK